MNEQDERERYYDELRSAADYDEEAEIDFLMRTRRYTYGQAAGYLVGQEALGKYDGLSPTEWLRATDDYAWGYRKAWREREKEALSGA